MHEIEMRLLGFLDEARRGPVELTDAVVEEFGEACKHSLRRQFTESRAGFTVRMSNAGKPACVLQMEAAGVEGITKSPWFKIQMMLGDLGEALVIALLRAAGVPVEAVQKATSLTLPDGTVIDGTLDLRALGALFDIKTASPWSFANKFQAGFHALADHDAFGYVGQLYGYAEAEGVPVGGWIALDKVTGQIVVTEAPNDDAIRAQALAGIAANVATVRSGAPFQRCFTDEPELFRKAETGNRVLPASCGLCDFRHTCWPEMRELPQLPSSGVSPRLTAYTHVAEAYRHKLPPNDPQYQESAE